MQTINQLCDEFQSFCQSNKLPFISADELLHEETLNLTAVQKDYLRQFLKNWDIAQEIEYNSVNL